MRKPLIPTEATKTGALGRIAVQVGHLIRPDLTGLAMELRARLSAAQRERGALVRQAERIRLDAYAAATRLMRTADPTWEPVPGTYFERVRQIERRTGDE